MPELVFIEASARRLWQRLTKTRRNEGGYSTEAVIITAMLAALAIAALAIIATKVLNKANSIQTQ